MQLRWEIRLLPFLRGLAAGGLLSLWAVQFSTCAACIARAWWIMVSHGWFHWQGGAQHLHCFCLVAILTWVFENCKGFFIFLVWNLQFFPGNFIYPSQSRAAFLNKTFLLTSIVTKIISFQKCLSIPHFLGIIPKYPITPTNHENTLKNFSMVQLMEQLLIQLTANVPPTIFQNFYTG